jgi:aryl-alcohol dehydrogenase-like predicted oxidoreductase
VETIDLLQLHCPPTDVLRGDSAFEALRRLQAEGKISHRR